MKIPVPQDFETQLTVLLLNPTPENQEAFKARFGSQLSKLAEERDISTLAVELSTPWEKAILADAAEKVRKAEESKNAAEALAQAVRGYLGYFPESSLTADKLGTALADYEAAVAEGAAKTYDEVSEELKDVPGASEIPFIDCDKLTKAAQLEKPTFPNQSYPYPSEAAVAADAAQEITLTVDELTQYLWEKSGRTDITDGEEIDLDEFREGIEAAAEEAKAALRQQKEKQP